MDREGCQSSTRFIHSLRVGWESNPRVLRGDVPVDCKFTWQRFKVVLRLVKLDDDGRELRIGSRLNIDFIPTFPTLPTGRCEM